MILVYIEPLPAYGGTAERRLRRTRFIPCAPAHLKSAWRSTATHSCPEEFVSTCRILTYERFLRSEGLSLAYAWQKRFLQHLQSRYPTKQWVLKSPDHLYALAELFSAFPDAVIIQTHRNPLDVLKSSIQLTEVIHRLFRRPDNADQLRDHETRVLANKTERLSAFAIFIPNSADALLM